MDTIHVIVADESLLVRLGITGIVYQTGFPVSIRETPEPCRFIHLMQKEHKGLVIISKTFVAACTEEEVATIRDHLKHYRVILMNDLKKEVKNRITFNEIIEKEDTEKVIYRKIEYCLHKLTNSLTQGRTAEEISQREKEVLRLVALGMTNKEIADRLFISLHTVITHRKNITAKLGIKTIAGLTVYALINKLISAEDLK